MLLMRLFFSLLVLSSLAAAQLVYIRVPGTPAIDVVSASNTTPISLTVADASTLSDGQIICVSEVRGNFAANGHAKVEGETKHFARIISGKVGNTFNLMDLTGAPVAGSGAYSGGGRIGRCASRSVPADGGVWMDGLTGPMSLALQSPARRTVANPFYVALTAASDVLESQPLTWGRMWQYDTGEAGALTIAGALRGFVDSRPAATAAAAWDLERIDQLTGTVAIDERLGGATGSPNSSIDDYAVQLAGQLAAGYAFARASMSPSARARYNAYQFNDKPWSQGGTDFTGAAYTQPAWKINMATQYTADFSRGTVTISGTALVGVGTTFLTDLAPGDIIFAPHPYAENNATAPRRVVSVTDNFNAVLEAGGSNVPAGSHYAVAPGWADTQLGLSHWAGRFAYDWDHGGASIRHPGSFWWNDAANNLTKVRLGGHFARGLASCGADTVRACLVAQRNFNAWYDKSLPAQLQITARGLNYSSVGYNSWRVAAEDLQIIRIAKASLGLDLCAITGEFCADGIRGVLGLANVGGARQFMPHAEFAGQFTWTDQNIRPAFVSASLLPSTHELVKGFFDVLFNTLTIPTWRPRYGYWAYMSYDPAIVPAPAPLLNLGNVNYSAECTANWGAAGCPAIPARFGANLRSGWGAADTNVFLDLAGAAYIDHGYISSGGIFTMYRNGKWLTAAGDDQSYYTPPLAPAAGSHIQLNAESNLKVWNTFDVANVSIPWSFGSGSTGALFTRSVLTDSYKAPANAVKVETQYAARLTSGGNSYVLQHDYVQQSAPGAAWRALNLPLNGVGTPASSSAFTANLGAGSISADFGNAGVNVQVLGLGGGPARLETPSGNPSNYSYGGGRGYVARLRVCRDGGGACDALATSAEWVTVFQANAGGGVAMPAIIPQTVGVHRIVEVRDSAAPLVAAFTAGGQTAGALDFTTGHAGTALYVMSGFPAGTYNVTRGGSSVGSFNVTSTQGGFSFSSVAGAFSVTGGAPALDISTDGPFGGTPAGQVGSSYSLQFLGSGGTPPLGSIALSSGTLPPGLTLVNGLLSGIPTTAGTFNFALSLTDAALATVVEPFAITITAAPPPPPTSPQVRFRGIRRGIWR